MRAAFHRALALLPLLLLTRCATTGSPRHGTEPIAMPPEEVRADLALLKMNDEELFAAGSSAFAAGEVARAAACFERLVTAFPESPHRARARFNAGLARERLENWDAARQHFSEIADPLGTGDPLDAAFHQAEALYHLDRYPEAATLLGRIAARSDLPAARRIEAQVQQGICQVDGGDLDEGEKTLRSALVNAKAASDRGEPADEYVTAQGQFFLGEIYRLHCEGVRFDPDAKADELSKTLEYKAELLLSAQGHYLRAIKIGNGYWATAAGERIGNLYEVLHRQMIDSPTPRELNAEEAEVYRQELRRRIKVLLTKAIGVYETTVATAERIGTAGPFVDRARASLERMKQLLLAEADVPDEPPPPPEPAAKPSSRRRSIARPRAAPASTAQSTAPDTGG
ncbi:MAG TPA: tetratricopeptide repeat protein [Myxococcaceae bacterium]|nr:tetratricopeptide repeat protein [Myxococcaceae bacterium]